MGSIASTFRDWNNRGRYRPGPALPPAYLTSQPLPTFPANFYALRHTFETIAGESRDQVAVDAIMGHSREDMASVYRERIGDDRLRAVAEHVRQWLLENSMEAARQSTS